MTTHIGLRTGETLPALGLGMWKVPNEACAQLVQAAVLEGYRHFDCACDYGNERGVGDGLRQVFSSGKCRREQLWITSKLWNTYHRQEHVELACKKSLSDLRLDYLDLYLIHFPIAQPFVPFEIRYPPEWFYDPQADEPVMKTAPVPLAETWHAMEALVEQGLVKHIGVCNYNSGLLNDLMSYANIKPAELQIESHPYLTQERLIRLAKSYGIGVTAFSPLGALSYFELDMAKPTESALSQDAVVSAARRLDKTPAQIVLRWGVQRGCTIISKSANIGRLKENINIFSFSLSEAEMGDISTLNQNRRFNDPGDFCEAAFNTFYSIYD